MPANWGSVVLILFLFWFGHQIVKGIRANEKEEVSASESDARSEDKAPAESTGIKVLAADTAMSSLDAELNKDPCVAVPFRGPLAPDEAGAVQAAEAKRDKSSRKLGKRWSFRKARKAKETKPEPMPGVFSENTDWSVYDVPTILRHNSSWAPPEWVPETSDQELAELVPAERETMVANEDMEGYTFLLGEQDMPVPPEGFVRMSDGKPVSLASRAQMELPLTRH